MRVHCTKIFFEVFIGACPTANDVTSCVPLVDVGDHVILTNTRHVAFTGNKWKDKLYRHHTG